MLKLIKFLNVVFMIITQLKLGNTRNPDALVLWSQYQQVSKYAPLSLGQQFDCSLKNVINEPVCTVFFCQILEMSV